MKTQHKRDTSLQIAVLALLFSFLFLITSLAIEFIKNKSLEIEFSSIIVIFRQNPVIWILIVLLIILPVVLYFVSWWFTSIIQKLKKQIDSESKRSKKITRYILKLINEDFETQYELDSEDDDLGKSLIKLRDTLKSDKELNDNRRKEDEIKNWHAEGLAKFAEILRKDNDNMEQLAFNVVKNLCGYVDAIQGGFYLLESKNEDEKAANEENMIYNLVAFYAYGRKKYADKQIAWGEGLIGTCGIEKKSIYLTAVPNTYVNITSGLGQANPRTLMLAPMIANEELFGVIELASLNQFEEHQRFFVEKVVESTASTLSTVKMNMRTAQLLEDSKAQAQALIAQEEEMRQNMEELQATQEEAARQSEKFMRLETTVNHTMIRAEYNVEGTLIYANTKFLNKLEYESNSDVEGKHISMFIGKKDTEWFDKIWNTLAGGGRHFEGYMKHITRTGKDLWTMATYTCVRNEEGKVEQILFLALDTTEQKQISLNLEGIFEAVNQVGINIEFDINGNIQKFNDSFLYLFKYSENECKSLTIFDLIDSLELDLFNKKWENIIHGINFQGQFKVKTKSQEEKWIRGAFSSVYDMYGDIEKVIYIGYDITYEKLMEIESKKQNEILRQQEKQLRESEKELSKKLREAKEEIMQQYKDIEKIKVRNERTLEGALDAIIITSQDNKIIFFNHAAEELLGYKKEEVLTQDIGILFSNKVVDSNDFVAKYIGPGDLKIIGERKEVKIKPKNGEEKPVLVLLSKAQVEDEITYTAFIQTIEVELF